MNNGVALLLERMKTHPEEFNQGIGKWDQVIRQYRAFLPVEDMCKLDEAICELMQQKFTEIILEGLVDPKPSKDGVTLTSINHPNATPLGGVTLGQAWVNQLATASLSASGNLTTNSLTLGNQTLDETTLEHMKAHLKALRAEQRQHQTLFGKLKNYLHAE